MLLRWVLKNLQELLINSFKYSSCPVKCILRMYRPSGLTSVFVLSDYVSNLYVLNMEGLENKNHEEGGLHDPWSRQADITTINNLAVLLLILHLDHCDHITNTVSYFLTLSYIVIISPCH